jgi:hypothetical protein
VEFDNVALLSRVAAIRKAFMLLVFAAEDAEMEIRNPAPSFWYFHSLKPEGGVGKMIELDAVHKFVADPGHIASLTLLDAGVEGNLGRNPVPLSPAGKLIVQKNIRDRINSACSIIAVRVEKTYCSVFPDLII